jgi:hypothetical protein
VRVLFANRSAGLHAHAEALLQNAERGLDPCRVALDALEIRQSHLISSMPEPLRFRRTFV